MVDAVSTLLETLLLAFVASELVMAGLSRILGRTVRGQKVVTGAEGMVGRVASVRRPFRRHRNGRTVGKVGLGPELWQAVAADGSAPLDRRGQAAEIVAVDGLTLVVRAHADGGEGGETPSPH